VPDEFWPDCELLFSQSLITTTISATHPPSLPRLRASFRAVMDTLMGSRSIMKVDDVRVG